MHIFCGVVGNYVYGNERVSNSEACLKPSCTIQACLTNPPSLLILSLKETDGQQSCFMFNVAHTIFIHISWRGGRGVGEFFEGLTGFSFWYMLHKWQLSLLLSTSLSLSNSAFNVTGLGHSRTIEWCSGSPLGCLNHTRQGFRKSSGDHTYPPRNCPCPGKAWTRWWGQKWGTASWWEMLIYWQATAWEMICVNDSSWSDYMYMLKSFLITRTSHIK